MTSDAGWRRRAARLDEVTRNTRPGQSEAYVRTVQEMDNSTDEIMSMYVSRTLLFWNTSPTRRNQLKLPNKSEVG
jgi:hypothetical protein